MPSTTPHQNNAKTLSFTGQNDANLTLSHSTPIMHQNQRALTIPMWVAMGQQLWFFSNNRVERPKNTSTPPTTTNDQSLPAMQQ